MTGSRRNLVVMVVTALVVGLLFLFPTSRNQTSHLRRPGQPAAPAGIVVPGTTPTG